MSIYIKGMEMPQNCHGCPLVDYLENCPCHKMPDHNFWDSALLEFAVHEDCPIGEVQPHGDLIDREERWWLAYKLHHIDAELYYFEEEAICEAIRIICPEYYEKVINNWKAKKDDAEEAATIISADEEDT